MSFLVKIVSGFFTIVILAFSCKQETRLASSTSQNDVEIPEIKNLSIAKPIESSKFTIGQGIVCEYSFSDTAKIADSVVLRVNGNWVSRINRSGKTMFEWPTSNQLPGVKNISFTAHYSDSTVDTKVVRISLVSDIIPQSYTYQIVNTFPHDTKAYTQGLFFEDGILYEGTGVEGQSTLRKIKLETGEKIKVLNLPPDVFGEGIASIGDKIYQLTWKNNLAFEYDKNTFEQVRKFRFPMNEGWGLTYNGRNLIMSDGTSTLYFLDNQYFTETGRIDVYDNIGAVDSLNELEYINNEIWANVYTSNNIVRIDPKTGKVLGKILIKDILKPEDYHSSIDYLNGIAYDKEHDRIFITGKNWPKLYEIKIVKK